MIAPNERMKGETLWFRPVLLTKNIVLGGPTTTSTIYGAPMRSESRARACALRIARALISAKCDPRWNVGIARSFNRSAMPSGHALGPEGEASIPELPPLPPLTGPNGGNRG